MSLFGKILTVFNVLAAIAFLVVSGLDYGKRQTWAYSIFRHELAVHGLPLDDKDDSWRPGTPIVKDLTDKTLADVFQSAGGNPVKTQLAAVEAMKNTVLTTIDAGENEKEQRRLIAAFWMPLVPHAAQRERLLEWIEPSSTKKQSVADLRAALSKEIDKVILEFKGEEFDENGQVRKKPQGPSSPEFIRMKVADLLYNLNPQGDPQLRARVQAVVGLEQFTLAADRQANNLFGIAARMQQQVRDEQAVFVRQYEELLPKLVVLNEQLKADAARLDQQKKLLEQHNLIFQARKSERDDLAETLRLADEKAAAETVSLAKLQQQLFDLERDLAAARAGNESLEEQIRTKELRK